MAQYKVPQDVEADDKLLGPFSFRQFVYLMIAAGLGFVAFLLFQIFPLLVIVPIPFIIFLGILALPLKKDQPMETYLSAVVDFYLKPQKRIWMPGQSDTTITITAPKNIEVSRTKDLSQEEASHRLSFLANIVDTEGYAIKETNSNLRDDIASEASQAKDIFETSQTYNLDQNLEQSSAARHAQLVEQMRNAINQNSIHGTDASAAPQISHQIPQQPVAPTVSIPQQPIMSQPAVAPQPAMPQQPIMSAQPAAPQPFVMPQPTVAPQPVAMPQAQPQVQPFQPPAISPAITQQAQPQPQAQPLSPATTAVAGMPVDISASLATIQPDIEEIHEALTAPDPEPEAEPEPEPIPIPEPEPEPEPTPEQTAQMQDLANNPDLSIETIAEQAKRIQENNSNDNEVYISLH
ncbi:MAG: PrgI family protein [Candidatus Saccharibacteria bacterium]|nr:PrgI family protein [Candidatus Saccharibacteria bacterium]